MHHFNIEPGLFLTLQKILCNHSIVSYNSFKGDHPTYSYANADNFHSDPRLFFTITKYFRTS